MKKIFHLLFCTEKGKYLVVGGLTTLVSIVAFWVAFYLLDLNDTVSTIIKNLAGIAFAYVPNRIWVFESKKHGFFPVMGELVAFAGGRVMTLLLQEGMFLVFHDWLHINAYAVKLIAAVLVIIANYFISKLLVFRRKKNDTESGK